jgi:hypothetical protein
VVPSAVGHSRAGESRMLVDLQRRQRGQLTVVVRSSKATGGLSGSGKEPRTVKLTSGLAELFVGPPKRPGDEACLRSPLDRSGHPVR